MNKKKNVHIDAYANVQNECSPVGQLIVFRTQFGVMYILIFQLTQRHQQTEKRID